MRIDRAFSTASFVLASFLVPAAPARAANKPRVAILEFKNKVEGWHWGWYRAGEAVQDMFVTELVKKGAYRVIEREQLQALMQEKNLSLSGDIDPRTAVKAGKLLGVEYLVTGALTELGEARRGVSVPGGLFGGRNPSVHVGSNKMDAAVDARCFSTTTGEIVWAETAKESTSDSKVYVNGAGGGVDDQRKLDRILRPITVKLAESLSQKSLASSGMGGVGDASGIVGKIAKADGGTLYLNVGSDGGVKEGDVFAVYRVGETIKDPDTGEVIGTNEAKVGSLKITAVKGPRLSLASPVSGSGFKAGDTVKK
jgi:curli biogenesis system outer membrane secretion channel CsgG